MTKRPERYANAVVPHIYIDGAAAAIDFYKRAFGAVELFRIAHPDRKLLHAEIAICRTSTRPKWSAAAKHFFTLPRPKCYRPRLQPGERGR